VEFGTLHRNTRSVYNQKGLDPLDLQQPIREWAEFRYWLKLLAVIFVSQRVLLPVFLYVVRPLETAPDVGNRK